MKIASFRPPNKSDFPAMPDGTEEPLKVASKAITDIVQALQGALTVADNFDAELIEIPMKHNTPFTVALQKLRSRPIGASCVDVSDGQIGIAKLDNIAEKKIGLRVWLLSEDEGDFRAKIIVWGGGI